MGFSDRLGIIFVKLLRRFATLSEIVLFAIPLTPLIIWHIVYFPYIGHDILILTMSIYGLTFFCMMALMFEEARRMLMRRDLSNERIKALDWWDFETMIGCLYTLHGYDVLRKSLIGSPDGGVDLVLHKEGKKFLVQCKHHSLARITVNTAREIYGLMCREKADGAILITSGSFSRPLLKEFEKNKRLQLIDSAGIMEMIEEVREDLTADELPEDKRFDFTQRLIQEARKSNKAILEIPRCPNCKIPLKLRHQRSDPKQRFWGCLNYSKGCNHSQSLSEEETEFLGYS